MFAVSSINTQRGIDARFASAKEAQEARMRLERATRRHAAEVADLQARIAKLERELEEARKPKPYLRGPRRWTYDEIERRLLRVAYIRGSDRRYTRQDIRADHRQKELVFIRQAIMYWAARLTGMSYPAIARKMGGRDHTTIMHGKSAYVEKRAEMGRTIREVGPYFRKK